MLTNVYLYLSIKITVIQNKPIIIIIYFGIFSIKNRLVNKIQYNIMLKIK